jgi:hypothetical protein
VDRTLLLLRTQRISQRRPGPENRGVIVNRESGKSHMTIRGLGRAFKAGCGRRGAIFRERVARVYEQNAPQGEILRRIGKYVRRRKRWGLSAFQRPLGVPGIFLFPSPTLARSDQHGDEGARHLLRTDNATTHSSPLPSRIRLEGSGADNGEPKGVRLSAPSPPAVSIILLMPKALL